MFVLVHRGQPRSGAMRAGGSACPPQAVPGTQNTHIGIASTSATYQPTPARNGGDVRRD
jgi:hypothetical protein